MPVNQTPKVRKGNVSLAKKINIPSGYTKRHALANKIEVPIKEKPVVKISRPLIPNIHQALDAMAKLTKELNKIAINNQIAVSVDPDYELNSWVLTVRGYEPLFDEYLGYPIRYQPSSFVRNPLSKSKRLF